MTGDRASISLADWLQTPAGRYLLAWEQQHVDEAVSDVFGFHALQLGLPELNALGANRMPHRWVAGTQWPLRPAVVPQASGDAAAAEPPVEGEAPAGRLGVSIACDFDALPFDTHSLDLVVLPHSLELAADPHRSLREVERVLVPEGRVVILGFNPASLWGLRQRGGDWCQRLGLGREQPLFLPSTGEFIGYRRLRDWLRLLSFEVETGRFGCYRPPVVSEAWLARYEWMERSGDRWWPVFGAVYALTAVKRVRGMRLVGLVRDQRAKASPAPAVVVNHGSHNADTHANTLHTHRRMADRALHHRDS